MNPVHIAFLALLFIAVFGTALVALRSFSPDPLRQRIDSASGKAPPSPGAPPPNPILKEKFLSLSL